MAGGNIEEADARAKIQMLQQRFGEGSGPIVVGWKRPPTPHIIRAFGHVAAPLLRSRHRLFLRMPIIIRRFTMYHMATMSGSEENQARTFRTNLPWAEERMKSAKIR